MTSFTINNITYTAKYVDISHPISGADGDTPWTPYNQFPSLNTMPSGTGLIVRRLATPITQYTGTIAFQPNICIIGSPKSTDAVYTSIPSASYWESDIPEQFTVNFYGTSNLSCWNLSGANAIIQRANLIKNPTNAGANSTNEGVLKCNSAGANIVNCNISISGHTYESQVTANACYGLYTNGVGLTMDNVIINTPDTCFFAASLDSATISNSTFKSTKGSSVQCNGSALTSTLLSSNFYTKLSSGFAFNIGGASQGEISYCNFYQENSNGGKCFSTSTTNCIFNECNFYIKPFGAGTSYGYDAAAGNTTFKNCGFYSYEETNTGPLNMVYTGGLINYLSCTMDALGIFGIDSAITTTNIFSNCNVIRGTIATDSPLYIPYIIGGVKGPQLCSRTNGILTCDIATMSGTSFADRSITLSGNSKIFVGNLDVFLGNGPSYNYLNFNGSEYASIYVLNEGNIQGNWSARSYSSQMTVTNSYRTGGSNYAIRCVSHRNAAGNPYLWIAPTPFAGIPTTFGTSGNKSITLYFAYKGYDPSLPVSSRDIILQSYIPADISGSNKLTINSTSSGIISDDTSSWNLDNGLTIKKLTIHFNLVRPDTVYSRIGFYKMNPAYPNSYLILDPALVGADVS